jgi:hypothetical protein
MNSLLGTYIFSIFDFQYAGLRISSGRRSLESLHDTRKLGQHFFSFFFFFFFLKIKTLIIYFRIFTIFGNINRIFF